MEQENNNNGDTGQSGDGVPNRPNERADSEVSLAVQEYVTSSIQANNELLFKKMSDMNEALFYRLREYMESRLGGIELRLTRIDSSLFNSETLDKVGDGVYTDGVGAFMHASMGDEIGSHGSSGKGAMVIDSLVGADSNTNDDVNIHTEPSTKV